jgi:TolB-like protein
MKYFVVLLIGFLWLGCATIPNSMALSLDEAIKISAENVNKISGRDRNGSVNIPEIDAGMDLENVRGRAERTAAGSSQKPVIAILNFSSQSNALSAYVIEELTLALAENEQFIIVDRQRLAIIRQEENFQLSGEVSEESAQAIGKKLGAQYVITGSLFDMNDFYRFRLLALEVETAAISAPTTLNVNYKDRQIAFLLAVRSEPDDGKAKEERRQNWNKRWNEIKNNAYRNYINWAPVNYAWDNSGRITGVYFLFGMGLGFHFSPVPFTNTGVEIKFGPKLYSFEDWYFGLTPSMGFVFPLSYNELESGKFSSRPV